MVDQGVGHRVRVFLAGQGAHGTALLGVGQRALIGQLGVGDALTGGADTRGVHEGEHALQALVFLADHKAGGVVEVHHAGGGRLDAHLLFQGTADHAVAFADLAGQILGHDEQRDALGALGRVRQAGQHDVHDVLGEVVVAGGNEDLGAGDLVGAIRLGLGLGFHLTQVGAALRLGQAHGARPGTLGERRQVGGLLLLVTVQLNGVHGAQGQPRVHGEGPVGGAHHFLLEQAQRHGQALAAVLRRVGQALPAAGHVLLIGFFIAFGRGDLAVFQLAALVIATVVERTDGVLAQLGQLAKDRFHHVRRGFLAVGQRLVVALEVEHFIDQKAHIAQGGLVGRHNTPSSAIPDANRRVRLTTARHS